MKANELMIGDWLKCSDPTPFRITDIETEKGTSYFSVIGDDGWVVDGGELEPIPLTAEILERNCKNILRWKGKGYEWTWYNEDDGYIELSSRAEGETCKDGFFVSANGGEYQLFTIHYVHELQHALRLCGIEKEIEL